MKKILKILFTLLLITKTFATDRIVQENGAAGTFPTISAAISAAVDGDRIVIYPKIGDDPFVENITVNKSLEFITAQDGVRYKIQGNISIEASNNRTVTIIGAHLVLGNISGASTTGWRTNVNVMGCFLAAGSIEFTNQYYAKIVSNYLGAGGINLSHGKVIGNQINNQRNWIGIQNSTSITNDTLDIIANITSGVRCSSNVFLNIKNNLIKAVNPDTSYSFSSIFYYYTSSNVMMNIVNNTIIVPYGTDSFNDRPRYLNLNSPALIKNNIIQAAPNATSYAPTYYIPVGCSSSNNFIVTNGLSYYYYTSADTLLNAPCVDPSTGQLILPTAAQNGADPSFEFYDLDLTRGDAGCFGGSYSLSNYFPITGSSRVYNIDVPFGISTSGGPLNIKADGFDR